MADYNDYRTPFKLNRSMELPPINQNDFTKRSRIEVEENLSLNLNVKELDWNILRDHSNFILDKSFETPFKKEEQKSEEETIDKLNNSHRRHKAVKKLNTNDTEEKQDELQGIIMKEMKRIEKIFNEKYELHKKEIIQRCSNEREELNKLLLEGRNHREQLQQENTSLKVSMNHYQTQINEIREENKLLKERMNLINNECEDAFNNLGFRVGNLDHFKHQTELDKEDINLFRGKMEILIINIFEEIKSLNENKNNHNCQKSQDKIEVENQRHASQEDLDYVMKRLDKIYAKNESQLEKRSMVYETETTQNLKTHLSSYIEQKIEAIVNELGWPKGVPKNYATGKATAKYKERVKQDEHEAERKFDAEYDGVENDERARLDCKKVNKVETNNTCCKCCPCTNKCGCFSKYDEGLKKMNSNVIDIKLSKECIIENTEHLRKLGKKLNQLEDNFERFKKSKLRYESTNGNSDGRHPGFRKRNFYQEWGNKGFKNKPNQFRKGFKPKKPHFIYVRKYSEEEQRRINESRTNETC